MHDVKTDAWFSFPLSISYYSQTKYKCLIAYDRLQDSHTFLSKNKAEVHFWLVPSRLKHLCVVNSYVND